jgi:hypothetical protein
MGDGSQYLEFWAVSRPGGTEKNDVCLCTMTFQIELRSRDIRGGRERLNEALLKKAYRVVEV